MMGKGHDFLRQVAYDIVVILLTPHGEYGTSFCRLEARITCHSADQWVAI
jgi:hypothetical protein